MIKIILIRHCETDRNGENRYLGSEDAPLNNAGRNHAELLGEQFKDTNIKKIYSSSLSRAYETAGIIAQAHSLEVEKLSGLNEIDFGDWEGLTFDEILSMDKEKAEGYVSDPSNFRFPNGETQFEVNERVLKSFDSILKKHLNSSNETILMAAHGGTNRIILGRALNLSLKDQFRIKQDIGCINIIGFFEETAVVSLMNYTIDSTFLKNPEKCVKVCEKCSKENCYSF